MPDIIQSWENPAIAQDRQIGLDALKPTPAQIAHGLELHEQATVVDTYGFSATAAMDPRILHQALADKLWPVNRRQLAVESSMTRMATDADQRRFFEEAWTAAGVTCVFRNSGEESNIVARLLERLAHNTFVTDRLAGFMRRAITAADVEQTKANGQHCFIFNTNGVPLSGADFDAHDELRYIRIFRQLGVRVMHMTYNRDNLLGGGCGETTNVGLTDLGREAVAEMNRVGVLVDLAHSSLQTALDAAACTSKPILITHAVCKALNTCCRAKTDEVIKAVAGTGGLMGIAAIPGFLGHTGNIVALLDHIDHVVKVAGVDHVAIGTDVGCRTPASPGDEPEPANYMPPMTRILQSHWPENDPIWQRQWNTPEMTRSLAWTNWPLFTIGLVARGYSDADILKILGGNTLRVLATADA